MASTIPPEAKRVQFTSFTSEDYAPLDEDKLFVFYCMHCSSHAIICGLFIMGVEKERMFYPFPQPHSLGISPNEFFLLK